jgi:hypothetical protein
MRTREFKRPSKRSVKNELDGHKCPVCNWSFTQRVPRMLLCGHAFYFCENCLSQKVVIRCMMCQRMSDVNKLHHPATIMSKSVVLKRKNANEPKLNQPLELVDHAKIKTEKCKNCKELSPDDSKHVKKKQKTNELRFEKTDKEELNVYVKKFKDFQLKYEKEMSGLHKTMLEKMQIVSKSRVDPDVDVSVTKETKILDPLELHRKEIDTIRSSHKAHIRKMEISHKEKIKDRDFQLEKMQNERLTLQRELEELTGRIQRIQKDFENETEARLNAQTINEDQIAEITSLKGRLKKMSGLSEDVKLKWSRRSDELLGLIKSAREELDEVKLEKHELLQSIKQIEAQKTALSAELRACKERMSTCDTDSNVLITLKAKITTLEGKMAEKYDLEQKLEELLAQHKNCLVEKKEMTAVIEELRKVNRASTEELRIQNAKDKSQYEHSLKMLRQNIQALKETSCRTKNQVVKTFQTYSEYWKRKVKGLVFKINEFELESKVA